MSKAISILSTKGLSKPAVVLFEKISDAIEGIAKPWQTRRNAQAEADAAIIQANAQIEIELLYRRTGERFFNEEVKKQRNMDAVIQKALPHVTEDATPEDIGDDWITHFFDKCRLISDEQMQLYWIKLLAGQANHPGRYSKRTIQVLFNLEKSDAHLFTKLCSCMVDIDGPSLLVSDLDDSIYSDCGINFDHLIHLESLGLLRYEHHGGYARLGLPQHLTVRYFDEELSIAFDKPSDNELPMGHAYLTTAGEQLVPLCSATPKTAFFNYVKNKWTELGYIAEPLAEQSQNATSE